MNSNWWKIEELVSGKKKGMYQVLNLFKKKVLLPSFDSLQKRENCLLNLPMHVINFLPSRNW